MTGFTGVVRKENALFRLLDGAEAAPAEVSARVVIARLLTAHPTPGGAQLRSKPAFPTAHTRHQTEGNQGIATIIVVIAPWFPQKASKGRGGFVRHGGSGNGVKAQIGGGRRWERVASQEDGMEIFEGGVFGDGERERRKGRK